MLARPCAGDVEQSPLCFVNIVELRFVCGIGHTLVEWQNSLVASHHDDSAKLQSLCEAHGCGHHLVCTGQPFDRSPRTIDKLRRPDEKTDLMSRNALAKPGCNHLANSFRLGSNRGEG